EPTPVRPPSTTRTASTRGRCTTTAGRRRSPAATAGSPGRRSTTATARRRSSTATATSRGRLARRSTGRSTSTGNECHGELYEEVNDSHCRYRDDRNDGARD